MSASQGMFRNPLGFKGRIRRAEMWLTWIIYYVWAYAVAFIVVAGKMDETLIFIGLIPDVWFFIAQSAKRCHDRNSSGWYQLIPFYFFVLLFVDGCEYDNDYGPDPKGRNRNNVQQNLNQSSNESVPKTDNHKQGYEQRRQPSREDETEILQHKKVITIGRSETCDICFPASCTSISRSHATISKQNGVILYTDHSSNGSFINGTEIHGRTIAIKEGDVIEMPGGETIQWYKINALLK